MTLGSISKNRFFSGQKPVAYRIPVTIEMPNEVFGHNLRSRGDAVDVGSIVLDEATSRDESSPCKLPNKESAIRNSDNWLDVADTPELLTGTTNRIFTR